MTLQNYFFIPAEVTGCVSTRHTISLCSRVVDDVELLALLEAEVILGAGVVLVQGDEQSHSATCGRNATSAQTSPLKQISPSAPCDVTKGNDY